MKIVIALLAALAAAAGFSPAWAPPLPATQCVSTAVAGGTGDAITIPLLPCAATTTILQLTFTTPNTSAAPTISMNGQTPFILKDFDGSSLLPGVLAAGQRRLLTFNGTNWFMLSGQTTTSDLLFVSTFGADLTGTTDSTTAVNNCLAQPGQAHTCNVDANAKLKIDGNISLPAFTTLKCSDTLLDSSDLPPGTYSDKPAIRLASGSTITATGPNARIEGCVIYPGFTLPQTSSSGWGGTAVSAGGFTDLQMVNMAIFGYNTCINALGSNRFFLSNSVLDCNGAGGAATLVTGNTGDAPFIQNVRFEPLANNNGDCVASLRDGIGWLTLDQAVFADNVVIQNYKTAQLRVAGGGFYGGKVWLDGLDNANAGCTGLNSIGLDAQGGEIHIQQLNLNGITNGINVVNNSPWKKLLINDLFVNVIDNVCVNLGAPGTSGGAVVIDNMTTNANSNLNCGSYAVNYLDTSASTYFELKSATLKGVHGGVGPYINTEAGVSISATTQIRLGNILTDLDVLQSGSLMSGPIEQHCLGVNQAAAVYLSDHASCFRIHGSGNVTSFAGVWDGRRFQLVFDPGIIISTGNNIDTNNGASFTSLDGSIMEFLCYGGVCKELSRSL